MRRLQTVASIQGYTTHKRNQAIASFSTTVDKDTGKDAIDRKAESSIKKVLTAYATAPLLRSPNSTPNCMNCIQREYNEI